MAKLKGSTSLSADNAPVPKKLGLLKKPKQYTSIHLDIDTINLIDDIATKEERSRNKVITKAILYYCTHYKDIIKQEKD